VTEVHGESLYATDPHGNIRQLSVGSNLYSDDKIESHEGSSMIVQASNGQTINIPEDVYDEMLSNAISKELSSALNPEHESSSHSNTKPHTQLNSPDENAQNNMIMQCSDVVASTNVLKASDIFTSDTNTSLTHPLSSHDFAQLYTTMPDLDILDILGVAS
jgi:hypothetical protein